MDMEHEIPKKLGVITTHGDGKPTKTLNAHCVKDIMHYFIILKKTIQLDNGSDVGSM